jgi:uncharacterized protein (DUF1330 family)
MRGALWISFYRDITNPVAFARYGALGVPAVIAGGGRFVSRGNAAALYEQGTSSKSQRTVVIEFPTSAAAIATYNSAAYREALVALGDAAVRDIRIVDMP